jgi:hypothetical protein
VAPVGPELLPSLLLRRLLLEKNPWGRRMLAVLRELLDDFDHNRFGHQHVDGLANL